jgi:GNAT superfamily N-acetyltransferase
MKGLKLFVRFGDLEDREAVAAFLQAHRMPSLLAEDASRRGFEPGRPAPADLSADSFLLGKLIGDLVAILAFDVEGDDALRVDCIVVADGLRRKRIGRAMLGELETVAAKLERPKIVINEARDAGEFFRRVGFHSEGETWVKFVGSQSS